MDLPEKKGMGCASGEGSVDEATGRFYWKRSQLLSMTYMFVSTLLDSWSHWKKMTCVDFCLCVEIFHHAL